MNSFRLYSIRVNEKNIYADNLSLISPKHQRAYSADTSNYFSLIIGNNGTGKSRLLCSIAKLIKRIYNEKMPSSASSTAEFSCLPTKMIAITNSISDRFPLDNSFKKYVSVYERYHIEDDYIKNLYKDSRYIYLGPRSRNNFFSSKTTINRALDILFEHYSETEISKYYRYIFDYLDFEPILKLRYKIPESFKQGSLFGFEYGRFPHLHTNSKKELVELYGEEIIEFFNSTKVSHDGYRDILINFSAKNIVRFSHDKSQYFDNKQEYRMLNMLRKLDIVRSYEVILYKKDGSEFSFTEASSGEANILSNLLALIPLLENNCLVLIDEPEISLHPIWQAKYINLLNKIFTPYRGCHIIIASHSHLLVTDLPPERSTVITLKREKKGVVSEIIEEPTFGWSAEDILLNVFGLPSARNYYLSQILTKGLELLADHDRENSEMDNMIRQIRKYYPLMKDNDPLKSIAEIIIKETTR